MYATHIAACTVTPAGTISHPATRMVTRMIMDTSMGTITGTIMA